MHELARYDLSGTKTICVDGDFGQGPMEARIKLDQKGLWFILFRLDRGKERERNGSDFHTPKLLVSEYRIYPSDFLKMIRKRESGFVDDYMIDGHDKCAYSLNGRREKFSFWISNKKVFDFLELVTWMHSIKAFDKKLDKELYQTLKELHLLHLIGESPRPSQEKNAYLTDLPPHFWHDDFNEHHALFFLSKIGLRILYTRTPRGQEGKIGHASVSESFVMPSLLLDALRLGASIGQNYDLISGDYRLELYMGCDMEGRPYLFCEGGEILDFLTLVNWLIESGYYDPNLDHLIGSALEEMGLEELIPASSKGTEKEFMVIESAYKQQIETLNQMLEQERLRAKDDLHRERSYAEEQVHQLRDSLESLRFENTRLMTELGEMKAQRASLESQISQAKDATTQQELVRQLNELSKRIEKSEQRTSQVFEIIEGELVEGAETSGSTSLVSHQGEQVQTRTRKREVLKKLAVGAVKGARDIAVEVAARGIFSIFKP